MDIKLKFIKRKIRALITVLLLLLLAGCVSNSRMVTIDISSHFWDKTVYVDVAGIKDNMLGQYKTCTREEFWRLDSELRNFLYSKIYVFNTEHPLKKVLSEDDPLWKDWKNDDYLLVFVYLPAPYLDVPWKIFVPLEYYSWFNFWDSREIHVYISERGVMFLDEEINRPDKIYIPQKKFKMKF